MLDFVLCLVFELLMNICVTAMKIHVKKRLREPAFAGSQGHNVGLGYLLCHVYSALVIPRRSGRVYL
jgi:hypothetical protein